MYATYLDSFSFTNSRIIDCHVQTGLLGVFQHGSSLKIGPVKISNTLITNNTFGSAIKSSFASATYLLDNCTFVANTIKDSTTGLMTISKAGKVVLQNSLVQNNMNTLNI